MHVLQLIDIKLDRKPVKEDGIIRLIVKIKSRDRRTLQQRKDNMMINIYDLVPPPPPPVYCSMQLFLQVGRLGQKQ